MAEAIWYGGDRAFKEIKKCFEVGIKMQRAKMDRSERAKIFLPFAALKGHEEALRAKERIVVDRIDLSEERKEELDFTMQELEKGDFARVTFFSGGEYIQRSGIVTRIDVEARILGITNDKIPFDEIYALELLEKQKM